MSDSMNAYENIVDGEKGENLRRLVRKRDNGDDQLRVTKRPRANTDDLLPPSPLADIFDEPPATEDTLAKYTRKRLQSGLSHIVQTLKRDVTPRTRAFLHLCKSSYKVALEQDEPTEASLAVVQAMDATYNSEAFLHKVPDPQTMAIQQDCIRLRKMENLLNYGHYLGALLQDIRSDLKEVASNQGPNQKRVLEANESLGKGRNWDEIADDLLDSDPQLILEHIYTTCDVLKLEPQHMRDLIKFWGSRCKFSHNGAREHIRKKDWQSLAKQICRDRKELTSVYDNEHMIKLYAKAMDDVALAHFQLSSTDNPLEWMESEAHLEEKREAARKKQKTGKD